MGNYKLGLRVEVSEEYKHALILKDFKRILDTGGNRIKDPYWIVHLQSPTASNFSFHPARAENERYCLWHNGMIESAELEKLKDDKGVKPWDTGLLLNLLVTGYLGTPQPPEETIAVDGQPPMFPLATPNSILSQISHLNLFKGSFACLYLVQGQGLYAFRNRIAPLFRDHQGTVCSITFSGATKTMPNAVYRVPAMEKVITFTNDYDPFGIA